MTRPGLSLLPTHIRKECEAQVLFVKYGAVSSTAPTFMNRSAGYPHALQDAFSGCSCLLESNTCSCRNPLSGDAPSRDAADRISQKGCAAATMNSIDPSDRCTHYLPAVAATPRAAL